MKIVYVCVNCGNELEQYSNTNLCDDCSYEDWEVFKEVLEK